jgi:hypothetical protein
LYKHSLIEFPLYVLQNLDYKKKKVEAVVPNLMSLETRNHVGIKMRSLQLNIGKDSNL